MDRGPVPTSLDGVTSLGGRERMRAAAIFGNLQNGKAKFTFAAYKSKDVCDALEARWYGKCAYCESNIRAVAPTDIEHYRPKGGFLDGTTLVQPGYWWLAADWSNLLPSCIDCNRQRRQELVGAGRAPAGKASQFPLAPGSPRARAPGEETSEQPLLLDPATDAPADHLVFTADGNVAPKVVNGTESARGAATIQVVALRRKGLADTRRDLAIKVSNAIRHLEETLSDLDSEPPGPKRDELKERLKRNRDEVQSYCRETACYTAVAENLVQELFERIGVMPSPIVTTR